MYIGSFRPLVSLKLTDITKKNKEGFFFFFFFLVFRRLRVSELLCGGQVLSDSCDPIQLYIADQAPLSMEFPRQEYWSGLPFPPPGDLRPGD